MENIKANLNTAVEKYDVNSSYDIMPSAALVMKINPVFKVNAGYSASVRYPDYTELYYNDPANQGNPDLKPEKCGEYSLGADMDMEKYKFGVSAFYRMSSDLIDWGKDNISDAKWKIKNIGKVNTAGFTATTVVNLDFAELKLSYTYLDSYRSESFISKYGLAYLRNKLAAAVDFELLSVKVKAGYTYKNYINRKDAFHGLDITLSRKILEGVEVSLKSENTLNWYFEETPGIPAMGRMLSLRVEFEY
jgi:iron complex outermembrane receptor protein